MRNGPTRSIIAAITGSDFFRWLIALRIVVGSSVASSLDGEQVYHIGEQMANQRIGSSGHRVIGPSKGRYIQMTRWPDDPMTRSFDPIFHDGKWKCTSCRDATGVPSSVAGW